MSLELNGATDKKKILAEEVAEAMKVGGVTSVRISRNDEEGITVDGKLGDQFRLCFRKLFQEEKQYIILNRVHEGNLIQWHKVTLEGLPLIIRTAKLYAFPEQENDQEKEKPLVKTPPRKRWVMPVALGAMAVVIGVSGVYLVQELRTYCQGSTQEQIQR